MTALRFAFPSKGRLKEQADAFFADAGIPVQQAGGARGYAARISALPAFDVSLLSASEIAGALMSGDVHLGLTGEDLLREAAPDLGGAVHLLTPLGFGGARLVVAVPRGWIDVETMADLEDVGLRYELRTGQAMRVATKYVRLTRAFFARMGISRYRIVESAGATEGAPAAGAAELIVDITTTGATLESNGLKVLADGLVLASQAQLAASLRADWSPAALDGLRGLMDILNARMEAHRSKLLVFAHQFELCALDPDLARRMELLRPGEGVCAASDCVALSRAITAAGAGPVRVLHPEFVFREANPQVEEFVRRLLP